MKRNLPARINNDPDFRRLVRFILEYLVLRLVTLYSRRILEKGAALLVRLVFSGHRDRHKRHYSY